MSLTRRGLPIRLMATWLALFLILRYAAADNTRQVADVVPAARAKHGGQEEGPGGFREHTGRLAMGSDGSVLSSRDNLAGAFAGAGALLLPVAMFLPWYRDANAGGGALSAWGGYWFVIAEMLVLFLAGAGLALGVLAGRPLGGPAVNAVIGFAFLVTITVVIALFIARPGGKGGDGGRLRRICGTCGDQYDQGRRYLDGDQRPQADDQRPGPRMKGDGDEQQTPARSPGSWDRGQRMTIDVTSGPGSCWFSR
jgi:hypothetical protein